MGRVRFALRSLRKAPMLSLVVTLSLGFGDWRQHRHLFVVAPGSAQQAAGATSGATGSDHVTGRREERPKLGQRLWRHGLHLQLAHVSGIGEAHRSGCRGGLSCLPEQYRFH